MAKFIFEMPEDMAQRVEAYRVARGLKATAQAVRQLIERGLGGGELQSAVAAPAPRPPPSFSHGRSKTVVAETKRRRADVVSAKRERVEAPKHVSRLKGEWKAP